MLRFFGVPVRIHPIATASEDIDSKRWAEICSNYNSLISDHAFLNRVSASEDIIRSIIKHNTTTLDQIFLYELQRDNKTLYLEDLKYIKVNLLILRGDARKNLEDPNYFKDYDDALVIEPKNYAAIKKSENAKKHESCCIIS